MSKNRSRALKMALEATKFDAPASEVLEVAEKFLAFLNGTEAEPVAAEEPAETDLGWHPGALVEYNDYGSHFRGRLTEHEDSQFWRGTVTEIYRLGDNCEGMKVGDDVSFVEGHSRKVADATDSRAPRVFFSADEIPPDVRTVRDADGWTATRDERGWYWSASDRYEFESDIADERYGPEILTETPLTEVLS